MVIVTNLFHPQQPFQCLATLKRFFYCSTSVLKKAVQMYLFSEHEDCENLDVTKNPLGSGFVLNHERV